MMVCKECTKQEATGGYGVRHEYLVAPGSNNITDAPGSNTITDAPVMPSTNNTSNALVLRGIIANLPGIISVLVQSVVVYILLRELEALLCYVDPLHFAGACGTVQGASIHPSIHPSPWHLQARTGGMEAWGSVPYSRISNDE